MEIKVLYYKIRYTIGHALTVLFIVVIIWCYYFRLW